MSKRLRLSENKANLISALTEEQVQAILSNLSSGNTVALPTNTPVVEREPLYIPPFTTGDPKNVFVIPDLHAPFIREGFLEWCREQQEKYNCGTVVCIGDIADNHAISYHESDPDGMSAGKEHKAAKKQLKKLFAMFPTAYCTLGNHDLLVSRKAKSAGLSQEFVRSMTEIYDAPQTWQFVDEVELYGVTYQHGGAGGDAARVAMHSRQSTVQGHEHSKCFVQYLVSKRDAIFGMNVGSGVDDSAYAFAYGRVFPKKSAISCGVVLEGGKVPFTILMPLHETHRS